MRRCIAMFIGAVLLTAGTLSVAFAAAIQNHDSSDRWAQPGRIALKLVDHPGTLSSAQKTGAASVDRVLARHQVELIRPLSRASDQLSKAGDTDLSRILIVHYASGADPYRLAAELSKLPDVEYAEPRYVYRINEVPDDPLFVSNQMAYIGTKMQFTAAWDVVKAEQGDVVVAVIDGGTDWRHRDLEANMWSNSNEIEGNLIDDDNNGYVDDVRGWNFGNATNDPTGLGSTPGSAAHGTHTAGIVCAVANNGLDIAGASWNAQLMPLCCGIEGFDGAIARWEEAIVYAAQNGADVINMSFGGPGPPSLFEMDIINFAHSRGVVLVAAAGQGSNELDAHYPSAYDNVFSVTNVNSSDVKAGGANIGFTVDVSATGVSILSTTPNDAVGTATGTSMSSPHAVAACALVKTRWPDYTPDQVMEQVRLTSDNIDDINSAQYRGLMGTGRVNAFRAVTESTPALQVSEINFDDPDGDNTLEPGEAVTINLTVTNILAAAQDWTFSLTADSPFIEITGDPQVLSSLGTMESGVISFPAQVSESAPEQHTVTAALDVTAGTPVFSDVVRFDFVVRPVFVNHTVNNIETTATSLGRIGFATELGGNGTDGLGFRFKDGPRVLFEGAMMIGAANGAVVDAARDARGGIQADFSTRTDGTPHYITSQPIADEQSLAVFGTSSRALLYVTVRQDVYGFAGEPNDDYVIFRYQITNESVLGITGMRVGWFNDWDIGFVFDNDFTGYDATRGLGYVFDGVEANGAYFGNIVLTSPGTSAFTGILNNQELPGNPWGLYDGFSKSEKWLSMSEGVVSPSVGPEDVSYTIAAGPWDLAPGQTIVVAVAYLAGDDLTDLRRNADIVTNYWDSEGERRTPVALFDLAAAQERGDIVLSWRTGNEEDVLGYRVYRSRDGGALQPLGPDVELRGDHTYSFRDAGLQPGSYEYRIAEVTEAGQILLHGNARIDVLSAAPARSFIANKPNPFNPSTTLSYGLAKGGPVKLRVYDGRGRLVRTLDQSPHRAPGFYTATWNGLDDSGQAVSSGVYLARLELAGQVLTRRMTLIK